MTKGLEALAKVRKAKYMFAIDNQQACDVIEKGLKALEIIKKHFKFRCLGISPHRDPSLDTCYVVTENIKEVPIEKWNFLKEVLEDE